MSVNSGLRGSVDHMVSDADTAISLSSGDVPVLATPRIVALCEEACMEALTGELSDEQTSVGSRVEVAHVAPVGVGSTVRAVAALERSEGRRLVFSVSVTDACGLVAAGRVTRVVVDRDHFVDQAR